MSRSEPRGIYQGNAGPGSVVPRWCPTHRNQPSDTGIDGCEQALDGRRCLGWNRHERRMDIRWRTRQCNSCVERGRNVMRLDGLL